jgi:predicted metal-dependent hydrolase
MSEEVLIVGRLPFEVRRSDRRRTIGISVGRRGELTVYAPTEITSNELVRNIKQKLLWVHRQLAKKNGTLSAVSKPEFVSGESFSFLGRSYRLQLVVSQRQPIRFDGEHFLLRKDARAQAEEHFRRWYRINGLPWLERRVHLLVNRVGVTPTNVRVRELGYRWGSCTQRENVYFNWKLLQLPVRLIDYVIVHELAHLRDGNHGPGFWSRVERALPDWASRREELAEWATANLRFGR